MNSARYALALCSGLASLGSTAGAETDGDFSANIVGGDAVSDRQSAEYLHTVRLLNQGKFGTTDDIPADLQGKGTSWRCSATIIHPRIIISAAHCFPAGLSYDANEDGKAEFIPFATVTAGAYFKLNPREDTPTAAKITKFVRHPGFDDRWLEKTEDAWNPSDPINDIAVALLAEDIPSFKKAAPLPAQNSPALTAGENITLAGYGRTLNAEPTEAPQLRSVDTPFRILLKNGREWYAGAGDYNRPGTVPQPAGACMGDSGGSAYRVLSGVHYLVGIIIRGPGNEGGGCGASVSIMTDVRSYLPWITQTVSELLK